VEEVLGEIGAAHRPVLLVYNKVDRLNGREGLLSLNGRSEKIGISALTGEGIEDLRGILESYLFRVLSPSPPMG